MSNLHTARRKGSYPDYSQEGADRTKSNLSWRNATGVLREVYDQDEPI